ncbi:glycosyltransferase [Pedobacter chinensis]|uniref:Glycosyltransferase n=1 Tax=Pedobacter chinensis TaxID=2282421 RepID=A0A369PXV3_9SPHI|nr:glycosyltransferase [Pedobacter chinensis]RDC55817.1 glycosyltransferase [Pedobacter chinensis]
MIIEEHSQPMVSIWMITYNHEKFIRQCLESVLAQETNFSYEIIIGEDCSTDRTRAIVQEFEALYPQIVKPIYQESNVGAYKNAYHYCYPALKGKYIACLEADDYWIDRQKLQKQVDALQHDPTAVACFTQVKVLIDNEDHFEEHWSSRLPLKNRYDVEDILKTFNITTCTLLFRNIYPQLPYDPLAFPTGDVSLSAFLLLKGDAIFINEPTAVYRVHHGGIYSPHNLENKNLVFVKIFTQLLKEPLFAAHRQLIKRLLADRAYQALCFEIKKANPENKKIDTYHHLALSQMHFGNLYYPLKTMLRKYLYLLTGKSFGRSMD